MGVDLNRFSGDLGDVIDLHLFSIFFNGVFKVSFTPGAARHQSLYCPHSKVLEAFLTGGPSCSNS